MGMPYVWFSERNEKELYPVAYKAQEGKYFNRAVQALEDNLADSPHEEPSLLIPHNAFEYRGNGIFHILKLSQNKTIGPVISSDERLDAAIKDWKTWDAWQRLNDLYLNEGGSSQLNAFLRDVLSEKYKTPPNPVAIKIADAIEAALKEIVQRDKESRPFFLSLFSSYFTSYFNLKPILSAFTRIDKECQQKAISMKNSSNNASRRTSHFGWKNKVASLFFSVKAHDENLVKKTREAQKIERNRDPEASQFRNKK